MFSVFVKKFSNPCQGRFSTPKSFLDYPPPTYKLYPEDLLEVDDVPLGLLVAELSRIMFTLLRNIKRKLMIVVAFVLFVTTTIFHIGIS